MKAYLIVVTVSLLSLATAGATEERVQGNLTRELLIQKKYLVIPVRGGAQKCNLELEVTG